MPYINVHGVNLYYEEYGTGPAVLLTPGGRVDRNGLRPIAALLSPKCRVILHDRRNCGRSDVVKGVFIWEVSGGPRSGELMAPGYYRQYIEAAERGGMAAVAETEFFT